MQPTITPIIFLNSVDSTNNYAMGQVHAGLAKHGMAWFAQEQYAGKGQRSKQWTATPGENITMSIALQPLFLKVSEQFQLSAAIALAAVDFFSKYAGEETKIKWPNDIYWRDRKAGGILIENIIGINSSQMTDDSQTRPSVNSHLSTPNNKLQTTNYCWAIAGIGININQTNFPDTLINPVSLKQITGKNFDAFQLATGLHQLVLKRFEQLQTKGFKKIYNDYLSHLYKINQTHKFKKQNRLFEATVKKISPAGKLVLQHAVEEEFDFGEIEWVAVNK